MSRRSQGKTKFGQGKVSEKSGKMKSLFSGNPVITTCINLYLLGQTKNYGKGYSFVDIDKDFEFLSQR